MTKMIIKDCMLYIIVWFGIIIYLLKWFIKLRAFDIYNYESSENNFFDISNKGKAVYIWLLNTTYMVAMLSYD